MISFITEKTLTFILDNTPHTKQENVTAQVYRYGIELLIASFVNYLSIIVVGAVLGRLLESLIFLFCFATLRQFTGGYHADSYTRCNTVFILSFVGTLLLAATTYGNINGIAAALVLLVALVPIALLCPVEHPNKPIDQALNAKCRVAAVLLWTIFSLFAVYLVVAAPIYGAFLFYTLLLVDVLVVIGEIIRRRCDKC